MSEVDAALSQVLFHHLEASEGLLVTEQGDGYSIVLPLDTGYRSVGDACEVAKDMFQGPLQVLLDAARRQASHD